MDKSFHEVQVKVAKRLIHSDRHRRRKSIGPDIVTCNSKNPNLSSLMVKNEILFRNLEEKMSSLQQEQKRRQSELLRTEKALTESIRNKSLPHLKNMTSTQRPQTREKSPACLKQPKRNSLINDQLSSSTTNQLVQKWLESFDTRNRRNTLQVPSVFDDELEARNAFLHNERLEIKLENPTSSVFPLCFDPEEDGTENDCLETEAVSGKLKSQRNDGALNNRRRMASPSETSARVSSRLSNIGLCPLAKIKISEADDNENTRDEEQ